MTPDASIILVSDYKPGEEKSWSDFRKALRGLATQDFTGTFEVLLVEETRYAGLVPPDLRDILPTLKVVPSDGTNSYALGNAGVAASRADTVILLDGDCTPVPGWLSAAMAALDRYPDAAAVSGLTRYPGTTLTERCLALLSRAYVVAGPAGYTRHSSNNNAAFRREAFLRNPLPTDTGVFASRVQAHAMERAGWKLVFDPGMAVIHDFEGWDMERDIRESMAHGLVTVRQRDPSLPHAWIVRMGLWGVPLFVGGRLITSLGKCLTAGRHYDIRPWHFPYAFALAARVHLMEIPGVLKALRGETIDGTAYR